MLRKRLVALAVGVVAVGGAALLIRKVQQGLNGLAQSLQGEDSTQSQPGGKIASPLNEPYFKMLTTVPRKWGYPYNVVGDNIHLDVFYEGKTVRFAPHSEGFRVVSVNGNDEDWIFPQDDPRVINIGPEQLNQVLESHE